MTDVAAADWQRWIGRSERADDQASAAPLAALAATLDRSDGDPLPGSDVPPLGHWLYFLPRTPQSGLGVDGHAARGGFLPPVGLPRRMWAGGRLWFHHALQVGDDLHRVSRIVRVDGKSGRSGALVFVTVRHEISNARGVALTEEQDIVYREAGRPGAAAGPVPAAPPEGDYRRLVTPDPVLLFRYSALTFNGHRIHYDRPYATVVEGYPGLVVHGPLLATLLVDLLRRHRPEQALHRFSFRSVGPLFDTAPFELHGRESGDTRHALWACGSDGRLAMEADAELVPAAPAADTDSPLPLQGHQ